MIRLISMINFLYYQKAILSSWSHTIESAISNSRSYRMTPG